MRGDAVADGGGVSGLNAYILLLSAFAGPPTCPMASRRTFYAVGLKPITKNYPVNPDAKTGRVYSCLMVAPVVRLFPHMCNPLALGSIRCILQCGGHFST